MKNYLPKIFLSLSFFLSLTWFIAQAVLANDYDFSNTTTYNQKIYGPANGYIGWARYGDINGDGKTDLLVSGVLEDYNSRADSGSVWIIFDYKTKLENADIGSGLDLSNTNNFNLRLDGAAAGASFGVATFADFNGDGKDDLTVSASAADYNSRTDSGSVYIFYSSLLENYANSTGNTLDMAQASSYNIRLDGPATYSYLSLPYNFRGRSDINSDGKMDLVAKVDTGFDGLTDAGSVYVIYSSLFNSLSGTGNTIDLNTSSNYNLRFGGDQSYVYMGAFQAYGVDLDNNGRQDFVIEESNASHSGKTGSLFIVYDSIFSGLAGTGNNLAFATSTSYSLRVDGEAGNQYIGANGPLQTNTDINGDGKNDLIIGAPYSDFNSKTNSGSLYIINNDILASYAGTGNSFSVSDSTKYSLRIDGSEAYGQLSWSTISVGDVNNDGLNDLSVQNEGTYFNGHYANRAYLLYNNLLDITGTGRTLNLSNSSAYTHKYEGISLDSINSNDMYDVNADGKLDFLFFGDLATVSGRAFSGVSYAILNFPHSISKVSEGRSGNTVTVRGTVLATKSTTPISGVQYQVDSNSPLSGWTSCTADDGSFNSTSEAYTCTIASAPESVGNHTVYIRSYDTNTSYTAQSHYTSYVYNVGSGTSDSGTSNPQPQIPQQTVVDSGGIFEAGGDSNTGGQKVFVIIQSHTFNFDAYLSSIETKGKAILDAFAAAQATQKKKSKAHAKLYGGDDGILGITISGKTYYQINTIQSIWYKAYAPGYKTENAAKIIPELQSKPSILTLSYTDNDLLVKGQPKKRYNPKNLKLAHSIDGVTWKLLPSSVVDSINHTIAALHKIGGFYMIVGR